jgi:hypothetical protein
MSELLPAHAPQAATDAAPMLGLLEALDRNNVPVARLPVTRWPVTVGRALDCDLVLDDAHVAAHHLRIDRPQPGGAVSAQVLDTINGVTLGLKHRAAHSEFEWPAQHDLRLGRLRLALRLADTPLTPELPVPSFSWRRLALTLGLLGLLALWQLALLWYASTDADKFAQAVPTKLGAMLGAVAVWCTLWALASKVFSGHANFWQHVRIVSAVALLEAGVTGAAHLLAFMFSWEQLARLDFVFSAAILAAGIYRQLRVVSPLHQRGMRIAMASIFLFAMAAMLGNTWLQTKRLTSQRQLASLFPPALRLAPTVPVAQFVDESKALKQKLDARLKDDQTADTPDDDSGG